MGAVRSIEAAKPFLEKSATRTGDASVVIVSSAAAVEADYESSYGPIKAALIHFAKGIARQQAPKHIRATVVSPGAVAGGRWSALEQRHPDRFKKFMERNPMGRLASAQEIANAVVFLASPVSSFTTGINMIVDGGFTARVDL